MSTAAQRMRAWRERAREGRTVVQVEIDEDDVAALFDANVLAPQAEPSRADLAAAIKRVLKTIRCEA